MPRELPAGCDISHRKSFCRLPLSSAAHVCRHRSRSHHRPTWNVYSRRSQDAANKSKLSPHPKFCLTGPDLN